MNKDVIYIEPEDDITDIILKIENSKEKIVALVPPKKAGVFRSVVNIKLIAKAGTTAEKTVVLVTVDPSILKLAAAAKLPVAKNLQTAPVVPKVAETGEDDDAEEDELVEEEDGSVETEDNNSKSDTSESEKSSAKKSKKDVEEEEATDDEDEDEDEEEEKPAKREKKPKRKSGNKLINWAKNHKKLAIFACICGVGIIALLIWMMFIAPAVDITVSIKTDQKNFSENVTFTDKLEEENAEEGKFYLEQKKVEEKQKIEFEATGKKNLGEKARGELTISDTLYNGEQKQISAGDTFTYDGLAYIADDTLNMRYNKEDVSICTNVSEADRKKIEAGEITLNRCTILAKIKVTAAQAGTNYNISSKTSGWSTISGVNVSLDGSISGGTDDIKTVVQQSDIIAAENQIKASKEEENKKKLFETIDDKYYIIDSSFEQTTSNATATPAADEEVKEGTKPSIEVTTTATVYVIDKVKLEEFIKHKADLADDQKIYDIKDIYVENMNNIAVGSMTKLKAQYFVGPKLTESELVDKIKGRGLGDARREISDVYGVSDVSINQSYPWVMAIPNDSNKITMHFEIKDQDGNNIEDKNEDEDSSEGEEGDEKKQEEDKKESE